MHTHCAKYEFLWISILHRKYGDDDHAEPKDDKDDTAQDVSTSLDSQSIIPQSTQDIKVEPLTFDLPI